MKFLKKWIPEPHEWPDKEPEEILKDIGWHDVQIESINGAFTCLHIAVEQLKYTIWKEITK